MLNWISLYSVNMLLSQVKDGSTPYTKLLFSYNKSAMLPTAGLNELFHNKYMTIGVPMAVIAADYCMGCAAEKQNLALN